MAIGNAAAKGFVPNNSQYGNKSEDRTEPQVGSIEVREIYRKYKEKWFLKEVYNELLSWNRWRAANRDIDGYLVHGSDPYDYGSNKSRSATESGKMKAAKWESGMDNSPMWDDAIFDSASHRMLMADVGLMSLYIVLSIADKSTQHGPSLKDDEGTFTIPMNSGENTSCLRSHAMTRHSMTINTYH